MDKENDTQAKVHFPLCVRLMFTKHLIIYLVHV